MRINADFTVPVVVRPEDREWVASPAGGVERCMLDRVSLDGGVGEVARATSLVRFAPGSSFPTHTHGGGEEYLVIEGTFSDETGDFPKGTYVRNPVGTAHAPHTHEGCTIFVKLHQFAPGDDSQFDAALSERLAAVQPVAKRRDATLHETEAERVVVTALDPSADLFLPGAGGTEVLVLDGGLAGRSVDWPAGTWARLPDGHSLAASAGPAGATVWIKTGHLAGQVVSEMDR